MLERKKPKSIWSSVSYSFQNYAAVNGRASRSEFWHFAIFVLVGSIIASLFDGALGTDWKTEQDGELISYGGFLYYLFWIVILVPCISLNIRRLHDIGKSGWWALLNLVPIVGWGILIYWASLPGPEAANEYGPEPIYFQ